MKHCYALSDRFTGVNQKNFSYGFANTNVVIAFESSEDRDYWVDNVRLSKAKALTDISSLT